MKLKYMLCAAAMLAAAKASFAQYAQDALRYSTFQSGSDSRIKAIGNAGTAIGGDLSSVSNNPAGLGFFTHSEWSITPEYDGSKTNATYFGQGSNASKNNLNLNNTAFVIYSPLNKPEGADKSKGWLSINFGAAYARTNNFYQNISYRGQNPNSSIANYYADLANSNGLSQGSLQGWAYDQYLIDQYGTGNVYQSNVVSATNQSKNTFSKGGQSEVDLSVGANYSNKFYLGFSLGIADLHYNTTSAFTESGTASVYENNNTTIANRTYTSVYNQYQDTRGTGVNLKLGMIYKPVVAVRIGATVTTPTWYSIDDNYSESLSTTISNGNNGTGGPASYPYKYNLQTPFKAAVGLAIFLKQNAFITGDVEYVDYSSIKLNYDGDEADNQQIAAEYKSTLNLHAGAEVRFDQLYLRGGYGVQGNPVKAYGSNINTASGGIGYRFANYYLDVTYSHVTGSNTVFPYELASGTSYGAYLKNTMDNVFLTFGVKF